MSNPKKNDMGGKLKDENKRNNCCELFSFVARRGVFFLSPGIYKCVNVESIIEKL